VFLWKRAGSREELAAGESATRTGAGGAGSGPLEAWRASVGEQEQQPSVAPLPSTSARTRRSERRAW